jgi:hypothetical protein
MKTKIAVGVLTLLILGILAYFVLPKQEQIQTPPASETTTKTAVSEVMPECELVATTSSSDMTLRWTSKNGTHAYLWHVEPMGADIVIATIKKGTEVSLSGSQTVALDPNNDPYALVVRNGIGAAYCGSTGERWTHTNEEIEHPVEAG